MTKLDALKALAEKVEAGRDMFLNGDISSVFGPFEVPNEGTAWQALNAFYGSLDAAKALHEAVLPEGMGYSLEWRDDGFVMAWLSPNLNRISDGRKRRHVQTFDERCYNKTPARAWLLCILKALIWKEEQ